MRKTIIFFSLLIVFSFPLFAGMKCFLAVEKGLILKKEGACHERFSPCSTFKIALSLMGYHEGILVDESRPEWPFLEGYADWVEKWKASHHPTRWMQNSCVWYSQVLTQKMGLKQFKKYVADFNYGNQDVSGDEGKENGLTHAWLSSSLRISPEEQIEFLQKLLDNKLPVSQKAYEMTRKILFIEMLDGWELFGKTGSGHLITRDGRHERDKQTGWFVGWLQRDDRNIFFAYYLEDNEKQDVPAGRRAKDVAKKKLRAILLKEKGVFHKSTL